MSDQTADMVASIQADLWRMTHDRDSQQRVAQQMMSERNALRAQLAARDTAVAALRNRVEAQAVQIGQLHDATESIIEAAVVFEMKCAPARAPRLHALVKCYRALLAPRAGEDSCTAQP